MMTKVAIMPVPELKSDESAAIIVLQNFRPDTFFSAAQLVGQTEVILNFPFEVEHIIPLALDGSSQGSNLALIVAKLPNISSIFQKIIVKSAH